MASQQLTLEVGCGGGGGGGAERGIGNLVCVRICCPELLVIDFFSFSLTYRVCILFLIPPFFSLISQMVGP